MGHTSGQEKALMALHREAEHRLRLAAAARNAHAVIGTRFDVEIIETTDDRGILQTRDRKPPAPEQPETD
jgi:uncharacterized protein YbjQ (UPF0145 family)